MSREIRQVTRTVQAGGKVRGHFVGFERAPHHYARTESIEVPIEIVNAHAADVARYLDGSGLDLPPILLAWLSPFLGQKEQPAKPVKKQVTKLEQFHNLLSRIEQAWLSSGREQIDRTDWPGTSKELCALAGRLLPEAFGNANPDSFYNNYSKAAKLNFHGDAGVSAIYAELFPAESQAARRTDAA
ncbi:MAG: hypothetical protein EKK49_01860 [Rhodocyclaceae bacterium]|nr:MAG: hypothetical protein EKK49_01860 [Rhodocyclaceae bacterium]